MSFRLQSLCYFIFFSGFLFLPKGMAQQLEAQNGSYGIDQSNKIIVWHVKNLNSLKTDGNKLNSLKFDETFKLVNPSKELTYTDAIAVTKGNTTYDLFITKQPIIHITLDTAKINNRKKILGHFTYFEGNRYVQNMMGIRHRGNLSLTFPKKSFDLEFWTDSVSKKSKDLKFKDMRSDDDWILDALYNEPLRLRSTIATRLWTKIHKPYYLEKEPEAKSGFDVEFVEVFKNNAYFGIYALSESVDRKQLEIRKNEENQILGELFKAESYEGAPEFKKASEYNNLFPHWGGFQMRYPLIDYRAHWQGLSKLVNLVVKGSDEEFSQNIEQQLLLTNAIDYYLLVNLLRATDNLGKNYFIGKYDKAEPYFFIPWDLDGVFGVIQEGKRIPTTNDILSNGLFDRLITQNPNNFKTKLKARWKSLRTTDFSDKELAEAIDKIYNQFDTEKLYSREQMVWPSETALEDHYEYLKKWVNDRLLYLDSHFENL